MHYTKITQGYQFIMFNNDSQYANMCISYRSIAKIWIHYLFIIGHSMQTYTVHIKSVKDRDFFRCLGEFTLCKCVCLVMRFPGDRNSFHCHNEPHFFKRFNMSHRSLYGRRKGTFLRILIYYILLLNRHLSPCAAYICVTESGQYWFK